MVMIELSVVTGTYNRLPHLQRMVESARQSIGVGIPYEIVLVDGGSTDGTIEWAKAQPDVVLIEQGELLGAIKAFNAGLYAAQGRYCVIGNDDVLYEDETLLKAISYMQDNPGVGCGCFYQDRDHPGRYDLSYMPAVLNGRQMMHVYGQVCIVPKWLGDEVGWWGDYSDMRTYGGDNNLSSFILEMGYRVTGIPCACIKDMKVEDKLRKINNADQIRKTGTRGGHPDSNAWGKHWTHPNGTCGAIISTTPSQSNPLGRRYRVMYLPIYELGHPILRQQKHGLRDALARYGSVYEYDWLDMASHQRGRHMLNYMMDIMDSWKPDMLLTQIHSPDAKTFNPGTVSEIRREFPGILWVNWNGDYHPQDLLSESNVKMASLFDMQCVVTGNVVNAYRKAGVKWMYWQNSYEWSDAQPVTSTPHHAVVFLANGYSAARLNLARMLRTLDVDVGIYGSWPGEIHPNGSNLYNFDEGARLYRAASIAVGDDQWAASGFVSNRLFQAMSVGIFYMQQRVPDLDRWLSLEDGKHYVAWDNLTDLRAKISYYTTHADERQRIAKIGTKLILEEHSFDNRVSELMKRMGE